MGLTRQEIQDKANSLGFAVTERLLLDLVGEGVLPSPGRGRYAKWPDDTLDRIVEMERVGLRRHPQRRLYFLLCDLIDNPDMQMSVATLERARQDVAQVLLSSLRRFKRDTFDGTPSASQLERVLPNPFVSARTQTAGIRLMKRAFGYGSNSAEDTALDNLFTFPLPRKSEDDSADDVPFLADLNGAERITTIFEPCLRSWANAIGFLLTYVVPWAITTGYGDSEGLALLDALDARYAQASGSAEKAVALYRALFALGRVPLVVRWWFVLLPLAQMVASAPSDVRLTGPTRPPFPL